MNRLRAIPPLVVALSAIAWAQAPLDDEASSSMGFGIDQSFSWSDGVDPAWSHTTGATATWTPAPNDWGLDEIRGGTDLVGEGFQFDSLWAVEPGVGISWSMGRLALDLDGWMSFAELDSLSDMGAQADLSFRLLEETALFVAATGTISENSGSTAGGALRWMRRTDRIALNASLSATREWGVDASAIASNLPRRLTALEGTADQWTFGGTGGLRLLFGSFSAGPSLSASAARSEIDVSRQTGSGKSKRSTESSTVSWALDVTPTLRTSWKMGSVLVSGTVGSTSAVALSSKQEDDLFQPWGTMSVGVAW